MPLPGSMEPVVNVSYVYRVSGDHPVSVSPPVGRGIWWHFSLVVAFKKARLSCDIGISST